MGRFINVSKGSHLLLDQLSLHLSDVRTFILMFLEIGANFVLGDKGMDGFLGSLKVCLFTENAIVSLLAKRNWLYIQGKRCDLI